LVQEKKAAPARDQLTALVKADALLQQNMSNVMALASALSAEYTEKGDEAFVLEVSFDEHQLLQSLVEYFSKELELTIVLEKHPAEAASKPGLVPHKPLITLA